MENPIKTRRLALGLTQAQFATKVGVATFTVQRWESGRSHPYPKWIPWIAGALGVSAMTLVAELEPVRAKTAVTA